MKLVLALFRSANVLEIAAPVTGELQLQLATRGGSYHCFISTCQTGSIASVSRQTFLD